MPDIPPTDLRRIQEFADTVFPGHQGGELVLWLPGRANAVFPVRVYLRDADDTDDNGPGNVRLSEGEQEILDAFDGQPAGKVLSVADIAAGVGCDNGSNLRERLGRLVRMKLLINERPGYRMSK